MASDLRFTVPDEHVAAALPHVQDILPEATLADVHGALLGEMPGIDPKRWHAWNRAEYQSQLDQASPRELAHIAVDVLTDITDLRIRDADAQHALAEAYRILRLAALDS